MDNNNNNDGGGGGNIVTANVAVFGFGDEEQFYKTGCSTNAFKLERSHVSNVSSPKEVYKPSLV